MKVQKRVNPVSKDLEVRIDFGDGDVSNFTTNPGERESDPFCLERSIDNTILHYTKMLALQVEKELE